MSWLAWLLAGVAALAGLLLALPYVAPSTDATNALGQGATLAAGSTPSFGAQVGSQLHPLILGLTTMLSLVLAPVATLTAFELFTVLAAIALLYAVARAGLSLQGWVVAVAACLLVASRPEIILAGASAYVDIPFAALVLLAALLAAEQPIANRVPVLWLLVAAGLLRPESWSLGPLYVVFLYAAGVRGRGLAAAGALALAPIAVWLGLEALLQGSPIAGASGVRDAYQEGRIGPPEAAQQPDAHLVQPLDLADLAHRFDQVLSAGRFTLAIALLAAAGLAWWVVRPVLASRRLVLDREQRTAVALALVAAAVLGANVAEQVLGLPPAFRFLIVAAICIVLLGVWTIVKAVGPRLGIVAIAALVALTLPVGSHLSVAKDYLEYNEAAHDEHHQLIDLVASARGETAEGECARVAVTTAGPVEGLVRTRLDEGLGLVGLGYGLDPFSIEGIPQPLPPPGTALYVRSADARWSLAVSCGAGEG